MTRVRQWAAPLLILSLAIVLRLHRLGDVHHDIDQAYPVYQAITLWQTGHWPGLGQNTSVLVANPAGMSYLMLIPWALFQTTWGAHIFVILLNLLTIPLIYQTVRAVGTLPQAEVAALLAATSPWLNRYSYGTWVQGLVPLWVTLVFALLVRASVGRAALRPRRWFSALVALAALTQMYLLAFLNVAQVAAVALAQWRKISWRGVWAAARCWC